MDSRQRKRKRSKRDEVPQFEPFPPPRDNRARSLDGIDQRYSTKNLNHVNRSSSFDSHGDQRRRDDIGTRIDNRDKDYRNNPYQGSERKYDKIYKSSSRDNDEHDVRRYSRADTEARYNSASRGDERRYSRGEDERTYSRGEPERRYSSRDEEHRYTRRDDDRRYADSTDKRYSSTKQYHSREDDMKQRYGSRDERGRLDDDRRYAESTDKRYSTTKRRLSWEGGTEQRYGSRDERSRPDDDHRYAKSTGKRLLRTKQHRSQEAPEEDIEQQRYGPRDESSSRPSQHEELNKWFFCNTCKHLAQGQHEFNEHLDSEYHGLNRELEKKNNPFPTWSPIQLDPETNLPRCVICPFKYHHKNALDYHLNCNPVHKQKAARADPRLKPLTVDELVE